MHDLMPTMQEPPELAQILQKICASLEELTTEAYYTKIDREHTKEALYRKMRGAYYNSNRIGLSWSKPALIEAYTAIQRKILEEKCEVVLRELHDYGISRETALRFVASGKATGHTSARQLRRKTRK